jgi:hypothetical protein
VKVADQESPGSKNHLGTGMFYRGFNGYIARFGVDISAGAGLDSSRDSGRGEPAGLVLATRNSPANGTEGDAGSGE